MLCDTAVPAPDLTASSTCEKISFTTKTPSATEILFTVRHKGKRQQHRSQPPPECSRFNVHMGYSESTTMAVMSSAANAGVYTNNNV